MLDGKVWGEVGGQWCCESTKRDGDHQRCVNSRRRPIPGSFSGIHSIFSNAAQPLLPKKASSVPIPWELKLIVTKSCSIRAGKIFGK